MLLLSPPGVCVTVVVGSPEVEGLVRVVTSTLVVVMTDDGAKVVGATEVGVWREAVLSAEAGGSGVVVGGLPVAFAVRLRSGDACGVELLGIVVPLSFTSHSLVCELAVLKVAVSAEERASRQHARVTKVAAMVLL